MGLVAASLLIWPKIGSGDNNVRDAGLRTGSGVRVDLVELFGCFTALCSGRNGVARHNLSGDRDYWLCSAISLLKHRLWPQTVPEWLALLALGLGPVGAAFFLWDIGMKNGDVSLLGALSYAAPVISTAMLVLAGYAAPSWSFAIAVLLMVAAAIVAAREPRNQHHPNSRLQNNDYCGL